MKQHFNRLLALLCAMVLTLGCAFAEPAASRAVITIDGVHAAFFSQSGAYCPPVEVDGIVYVAALSLGQNLGVEVEASADPVMVTVRGVRPAFFGPDGAYLPPIAVDGEVYVPLQAFVENLGIPLTVEGSTYAIVRSGSAPTAVPAPAATPAPAYGHVPVSEMNCNDFFTFKKSYEHTAASLYANSFTITMSVTAEPTTGYDLTNVELLVQDFGTMKITANGGTVSRMKYIAKYDYVKDIDYVNAIAMLVNEGDNTINSPLIITSGSGTVRMSWQEAQDYLARYYARAEACEADGDHEGAAGWFSMLAQVEYLDSAERASAARERHAAAVADAAQAQLSGQEQRYQAAETALAAGEFALAIETFAALADENFRDSADRHAAAVAAEQQHRFDQAGAAETAGELDTALSLFAALAEEGFSGAGDRVKAVRYAQGEALLTAGDYAGAVAAFADAGAADRVSAAHSAQGEALLTAGDHDGAIAAFTAAGTEASLARIPAAYAAQGEALLAAGDHAGAVAAFTAAGDHSGAAARIPAVYYAQGEALLAAGNGVAAIDAFLQAGSYRDAAQRAAALPVEQINLMMARGSFSDAFSLLNRMGEKVSPDVRRRTLYLLANAYRMQDDHSTAMVFFSLSGYADYETQVRACWYEIARDTSPSTEQYSIALQKAGDYADAKTLLAEYYYVQGKERYRKGDDAMARYFLLHAAGYKDTDEMIADRKLDQIGTTAMNLGNIVTFGTWAPIGGDGTPQPIEWIVVEPATKSNKDVTLLSRYVLDMQPFSASKWQDSTLRTWLNGTFLNTAFTQAERGAIRQQSTHSSRSKAPKDKVLLLTDGALSILRDNARQYLAGYTVTGEPAAYWDCTYGQTFGTIRATSHFYHYSYQAYSQSAYVRPLITVNTDSAAFKSGGRYAASADLPREETYLLRQGRYRDLLERYNDKPSLLNNNTTAVSQYNECLLRIAADAFISGDAAAAVDYLNRARSGGYNFDGGWSGNGYTAFRHFLDLLSQN